MVNFNLKTVYSIAKKEFLDNSRNKWILVLTGLFIILPLLISLAFSGTDKIFGGMDNTVLGLVAISSLLIPFVAIILGFSTISGEDENGALSVVLSYPVRRIELLFGKILGLGSVLVVSIFIGFGLSGVIITLAVGEASWAPFIAFILYNIGLGFVFLTGSIFISALCKSRTRSIGGAILLYFFGPIVGMFLMAIGAGMGYKVAEFQFPPWMLDYQIPLSPPDLVQTAVPVAYGTKVIEYSGMIINIPEYMTYAYFAFIQLTWIIIFIILGYLLLKKREI
ncbi:MAG: ABC transporter permease [Thermoplasmatales archaeon]|nr:ABC transporter permease [Thermoplasmatales archaeon]